MMNKFKGYLLNTTKYKDYDLICDLLTDNGLITFINRNALKANSKLNCNIYRLCFIEVELYKGNQKFFMIKNLNLIKSTNLQEINLENVAFYNFLSEITLILCKNNSFNQNLLDDFKNTIDSLYLNVDKYFYILNYFVEVLNLNGVLDIKSNDFKTTKENLIAFFEYHKLLNFIDELNDININTLLLKEKNIKKENFKNCFFILTLIYESSFNQKLNSSELIYII